MKKQESQVRKIFFKVRMNPAEMQQLKKLQQQSTERSVSNYVRKVALQKPIIIKYRNQTADDFLTEMVQLKKELNAVGNNFNQVVHKLHILDKIPEFRTWIKFYMDLNQSVVTKVADINSKVIQLYEQWLQK
ncbi:MAG: plasmid mobilization relaxosome protein MobC [Chitinophagaceae bacterium]